MYRRVDGQVRWLIRRAAENPEYRGNLGWTLPKGWIDDTEEGKNPGPIASGQIKAKEDDLIRTALREVREETGVVAKIISQLSTLKYIYTNLAGEKVMKFVTYFLMEYEADVPEGFGWETAEIRWVTKDEMGEMLEYSSEKTMAKTAWEKMV